MYVCIKEYSNEYRLSSDYPHMTLMVSLGGSLNSLVCLWLKEPICFYVETVGGFCMYFFGLEYDWAPQSKRTSSFISCQYNKCQMKLSTSSLMFFTYKGKHLSIIAEGVELYVFFCMLINQTIAIFSWQRNRKTANCLMLFWALHVVPNTSISLNQCWA